MSIPRVVKFTVPKTVEPDSDLPYRKNTSVTRVGAQIGRAHV